MKLSPDNLIALLPADTETLPEILRVFEDTVPTEFASPGFLVEAVREGWTKPVTISVNNVPAYLVTFHLSPDGGLWIDVVQSLSPVSHGVLAGGIEQLAKANGCRYARCATRKRGVVRIAEKMGFRADAVIMTKGFC